MQRRDFLKLITGIFASTLFTPFNLLAANWNKSAFETNSLVEAENSLAITDEKSNVNIVIIAPNQAENGAIVQVEVISNIPNTETISILVEKNPTPLIASFKFSHGAEPFVITRIKMAETSDIKVVVKAGTQYFSNSRNVIVLENGCG